MKSTGAHPSNVLQWFYYMTRYQYSSTAAGQWKIMSENLLTLWGWVMHICASKLIIIGSDNGLSPGRRQAIIWTFAGIFLIQTLGTKFSEILSEIHTFSFKKMHLKMLPAKWQPFCLDLNVLTNTDFTWIFAHNPDPMPLAPGPRYHSPL